MAGDPDGPDQYNWTELDSIVDTAAGDQLNIILTVVHAPGFLRSGSSGLFPSNPDTYESFMRTIASRYAGRVDAYQLWNEQNLSRETGERERRSAELPAAAQVGLSRRQGGRSERLRSDGRPKPDGRQHPWRVHRRPRLLAAVVRPQRW